jgi:16S rRNA (adenine1518-N6/adenine1519-N6)-dimethyltransferase
MTRQVTLARLQEFGVVPDRELGQNFLIDDNVLGIIGRLAELEPRDVALEVGPGLGVLTRWLADRVALVHAVEIDQRLRPALEQTLAGVGNVELRFEDAVRIDLGSLAPVPTVLVANLPYSVATPVIMRCLPLAERACVMVQKEIADRLFAAPATRAYAAVSVLVQLACERTGQRAVSRRVFVPEPNVDSALVAYRRRPGFTFGPEWEELSAVVRGAFAHRRKTLANSLALAGLPPPPERYAALRAEALAPEQFLELVP